MLSPRLEQVLENAEKQAKAARHEYVTLEHLLLSLIDDPKIATLLQQCGADLDALKQSLQEILNDAPTLAKKGNPTRSLGLQRAVQRAMLQMQAAGKNETQPEDVLVAIYAEEESYALYFLEQQNISRLALLQIISHGTPLASAHALETEAQESISGNPLADYAVHLNQEVREGRIDPLIGRQNEMQRILQILCRRRKNNPLLVGEAGVGKTALAEGLAYLIEHQQVPEALAKAQIFALDMGAILAGTKYRGDFEARMKAVLNALAQTPESILFIDEIHTVIGAGSTQGSAMDASNLLKPALAKGTLRCIGATTYEEHRSIFSKDHALSRRFQKVDLNEPSISETIAILQGLKPALEAHHGVRYSDEALQTAAELSAKYIQDRFLPDKAIDIIDEAGAAERLKPTEQRVEHIGHAEIERIIAQTARIPEKNVSSDDKQILRTLASGMKTLVFGQNQAIDALAEAIKIARSGLSLPDKPVGCFLFSGPTGVGKTEVAKQLAYSLGIPLQRFDMSEYMESHAVSRLIGAPPGYVGYEQAGLLTETVNKHPHCVLLLDEIEKAHRDIYNLLLQVMDAGRLTDNTGKSADFRNVILIMTTNAGAEALSRPSMGFTGKRERGDEMADLKKLFSPEFRNRLDAIIPFAPLTPEIIRDVVNKFLLQLEQQLNSQQVSASFGDTLRSYLAEKGFDPQMGARPMNRLIRETIRSALADELLFGKLVGGGKVHIDWDAKTQKVALTFPKRRAKTT